MCPSTSSNVSNEPSGNSNDNKICQWISHNADNGVNWLGAIWANGNLSCVSLTQTSDRALKDSIRVKSYNSDDYLTRLLATKVYTYIFKDGRGNGVELGLMYDEIFNQYGYLTNDYKPLDTENIAKTMRPDEKYHGVDYSKFSLYLLLGFQQFYNNEYMPLKNKVDSLEIVINKLVDKLAYLSMSK